MEIYDRVTENLGKLQRNETQMTEEQKKKYAAPIAKLKKEIAADATELMHQFIMSGCRMVDRDKETADWKAMIRKVEEIMKNFRESGESKKVSKVLFTTYSLDKFFEALLPVHNKVWYEAYGPYWLTHCTPTFEDEFTFTNDIIGMEWWDQHNEWAAVKIVDGKKECDYQKGVTIMLPPTRELLDGAYQKDMEALKT